MKGDFTRFTHDPARRFSAVLLQQGRVQLDADWNEHVAIRDRIARITARDVIGPAGAPENDAGFGIGIGASGVDLTISAGRIYVDGILCELDAETAYTTQPYWLTPDPLLDVDNDPALAGRTDLVFLEVWQRHVSAVEDPALLDPALNGIDTATRVQTVWRVRTLKDVGDVTCSDVPGFPPAAGGALLTADAVATPNETDPCGVVVAGGYRGVENRLYRLEIHDPGDVGTATWKWSRDNGAVAFAVEEFFAAPASQLRLSMLGRDRVLTLRRDDWVEILDDAAELGFTPGFTAQVVSVNDATRVVTLDRDVPAGRFEPARNARIRRWDHTEDVNADGVLLTAAGPIDLEDGIQVSFNGADYRAGDYWTFAARVADGDIEGFTNSPAQGIVRHHAALALIAWVDDGTGNLTALLVDDCRDTFPPLTDICADDVCFDDTNCQLGGATTVQEAIDQLCGARDLRFHNKHLHGWGIVCGLQVACGPNEPNGERRQVTLRPGYAIDCEGNDILLDDAVSLDLLDRIQALDALDPNNPILVNGDGDVCLILARNGGTGSVEVERFTAPTSGILQQALQATLLMDIYQDCIQRLLDFLRERLGTSDETGAVLVGQGRRRRTAVLNLAIQAVNPANGRFVYLSPTEDRLLREFYADLRALLSSSTFCAMFANARPLPAYPFPAASAPATVFGKGLHTRLRLRPNTQMAYTVGAGDEIHVFDLAQGELVAELKFPGGAGLVVQDVAFSRAGDRLLAIATLGPNTLFAVADIRSPSEHRFRPVTVLPDVNLLTLETHPDISQNVFAIGRGAGLFEINPDNPGAAPRARIPFNAVGHLAIGLGGEAVATARTAGQTPDRYDTLQFIDLRRGTSNAVPFIDPVTGGPRSGVDGVAIVGSGQQAKVYAVADVIRGGFKDVIVYAAQPGAAGAAPRAAIPVENTEVRLRQLNAQFLLVALQDSHRIEMIDIAADQRVSLPNQPFEPFAHPVQIGPSDVVHNAAGRNVAVLNSASGTISLVPVRLFEPARQIDRAQLAAYRDAMLAAFTDLAAGFLQYLKDCFCDHLLVNCPECDEDDVIYLGSVSVRGNQVHRVCNFSRRKYVKTFATVEYWLSAIPILPLLKLAVERFCCLVLPDLFGRFDPGSVSAADRLRAQPLRRVALTARTFDFAKVTSAFTQRASLGRSIAADFLGSLRADPVRTGPAPLVRTDVVGSSAAEATTRLQGAGLTVAGVQRYDPSAALGNVIRFTAAPIDLAAGTPLILYQDDDGVVRGYEVARTAAAAPGGTTPFEPSGLLAEVERMRASIADLETARAEVAATRAEMAGVRAEMSRVEQASAAAVAARDVEIASLRAQSDAMRVELRNVDTLRADVDRLMRR